jgi:hypothetical protein
MVILHSVAAAYGCRPSAIVGITNDWVAYQFDIVVLLAYTREQEQRQADRDAGRPSGAFKANKDQQFKTPPDPSTHKMKAVAVPKSGVW